MAATDLDPNVRRLELCDFNDPLEGACVRVDFMADSIAVLSGRHINDDQRVACEVFAG